MSRTLARAAIFTLKCVLCKHAWTQRVKAGQADAPVCPRCLGPSIVTRTHP